MSDTELIFDQTIEDVGTATKHLIWNRYRKWSYGLLILGVVITAVLIIVIFGFKIFVPQLFITPFAIWLVYYGIVRGRAQEAFMHQFAQLNGYSFAKYGILKNYDGSLFKVGHGQLVENLISGEFSGVPLELFNYQYTVGHGKHSHTYDFTISQISFAGTLPNIVLKEKKDNMGISIHEMFSGRDHIDLEGDFSDWFDFSAEQGMEIEALQIFTPDFMIRLRDEWPNYSLEFKNNHLYIYENKTIAKRVELEKLYALAKYTIDQLKSTVRDISDDVTNLRALYNKN